MRNWCRMVIAAAAVAVLAGCASQAYDPAPRRDVPLAELSYVSPLDVEGSYRLLHARLTECAAPGYHVLPRFEREPLQAWVMVVSGLGLDRYSFLLNQFEARFQVNPELDRSRVTVSYVPENMAGLAEASRGWLVEGRQGC